jgi:hypothetical protein
LRKQKRRLYYLQETIYLVGKKARKLIGSAVSLIQFIDFQPLMQIWRFAL